MLGELARALRSLPLAGQALRAAGRPASLPLSFAQARLWFLHRLEGAGATYNIPVGLRLHGALDVAALARALGDVVMRHESLRTLLLEEDGEPCQQILGRRRAGVLQARLQFGGALEADWRGAAGQGFDLARELPLRATLFALGPETRAAAGGAPQRRRRLVDGAAAGGSEPGVCGAAAGEAPAFAPLPVQYADYTLWQRALLGRGGWPPA